jgi:hypothetical protein
MELACLREGGETVDQNNEGVRKNVLNPLLRHFSARQGYKDRFNALVRSRF